MGLARKSVRPYCDDMAKRCETFDHTADVGLAAVADTLGELFEAMGEGLAEFILPREQVAGAQVRHLAVTAEGREGLLIDFLSRLLYVMQTEHFAVSSVAVSGITDTAVQAQLAGEPYDPRRHEIHTEVKAVTYHQLQVRREANQWTARVILDL